MGKNRMKEYRISRGITMSKLSEKTGISVRIYMSFRKGNTKKSIWRSNAEYSKGIRSESIRNIFLGVEKIGEPEKNKEI